MLKYKNPPKDNLKENLLKRFGVASTAGALVVTTLLANSPASAATPSSEQGSQVQIYSEAKLAIPVAKAYAKQLAALAVAQQVAETERRVEAAKESSALYAAWSKVAVCEEGGWNGSSGYNFPNSLGITRANWSHYGGTSDVSPEAQIAVAERMVDDLGINIPDQNGCQPGGW